jgi:thymidylate kinase
MHQRARTIAIVGPDGSGKTTQSELLVERLRAAGYDAQYVHALYYLSDNVPRADRLRRRLGPRNTRTHASGSRRPTYLLRRVLFGVFGFWFALLTIGIVSVRFRGRVVVFDRYYQQFFYDVYGSAGIALSRLLPGPWRTVYLDADLTTVRDRMGPTDRAVDESYYATVIDLYDDCSTTGWQSFRAELPIETLHERIFEAIRCDVDRKQLTARRRGRDERDSPL